MSSLTNTKIKDTYPALLKADDNGIIGASEKVITDGLGNASVLSIGTASASFSSDIEVNTLTIGLGSGSIATNTAIGLDALLSNTSGAGNVAVGQGSLRSNTTGGSNTAVGKDALRLNTTGISNTALGINSLNSNTEGSYNVSLGAGALSDNTTGDSNIAIGFGALEANTTGAYNVAIGHTSLDSNTIGQNNTAVGYNSLYSNTTGLYNTALGSAALYANQTSGNNTALGYFALRNNIAANNTAVGSGALADNTTGGVNTAVGKDALNSNTTGGGNTAIGYQALQTQTAQSSNTAIGHLALKDNVASNNTAVGSQALTANTTGVSNVALGKDSLSENTTGGYNTAVGAYTLEDNTTGSRNTAVGFNALDSNTEGSDNTAIGHNALDGNTTGVKNTAVGRDALLQVSTGFQNTALGFEAANDVTTGSNNVHIGYQATASSATVSNEIVIGSGATGNGSNTATYGNSNITDHYFDGNITLTDATNPVLTVQDTAGGSSFLRLLAGDTGTSNIYLGDATDDNAGAIVYDHSDNSMSFRTNGFLEKMSIDSSGNVSTTGNLSTKLLNANNAGTHFIGVGTPATGLNGFGDNLLIQETSNAGMTIHSATTGFGSILFADSDNSSAGYIRYEHANGILRLNAENEIAVSDSFSVDTNTLYVDAANNRVGVRESSPIAPLDVHSDGTATALNIRARTNTDFGNILFSNEAGTSTLWAIGNVGNDFRIVQGGSSEAMRIDSSGNVGIGGSSSAILHIRKNDNTVYDPTADDGQRGVGATIELNNNSTTTNTFGQIMYDSDSSGQGIGRIAFIDSGASSVDIAFVTEHQETKAERMRITSSGDVLIGTQGVPNGTSVYGAGFQNASAERSILYTATNTTSSAALMYFANPNGFVGNITVNGIITSFNSTSDYRLKENVIEMTGALDRVDALKPSRFNYILDPEKTVDGFLAHEVAEVVPEAITGEKDAVDEEGNPIYQGIDQSKIVPLLVGAIKELRAEIELLKSQLS